MARTRSELIVYTGALAAVVLGLYASSRHSYLLFHGLVEFTTIAIAATLCIITWNTRRFLTSGSLKALGTGYGLIAGLDLLHALAYKGMGVFPADDANLPTQLWIAARALQAILLCVAPLLARRNANEQVLLATCLGAVLAVSALVFSGHFPDCFIEGRGLTRFKIISEYVISALLLVALLLFIGKRTAFSPRIFPLIVFSTVCTIGSELAFTAYLSVYGPANMAGHFLKLAAFYLLYRALVVTGLQEPFELIFRELKQAEEGLTRQREFNRCLLDSMADGVAACDAQGILTLFNRTAREWHGIDPMRLPQEEWARHYDLFRADGLTPLPTMEIPLAKAFKGETVKDAGMAIVAQGQPPRFILANGSVITDADGHTLGAVVVMRDITTFRRMEQELRRANEDLERRVAERTAELRLLLDNIPDCIVRYDTELRRTYVNPSWEKASGLSREEVVHVPAAATPRVPQPVAAEYEQKLRRVLQNGTAETCGFFWTNAFGAELYLDYVIVPEHDRSGAITGALAIGRDLSERRRAEDEMRRLNRELRAISNCNQSLMKAEDEQTLLDDICRIICAEAGYRLAWVGYAEHDREKTIRPVAWAGLDADYVAKARLSWSEALERGQGPAGLAIRSGEAVHIEDFATDPRMAPWRESALARGYRSGIALPLKDQEAAVFGVLLIYSAEPYAVTAEEFKLLEGLAGDLAFGITVLRTRTELKRTEQVARARLRMLERAYAASITLDDVLRGMLDEIEAQTGSSIAFYHFLEEDQQTLALQSWSSNTVATMCTAEGKGRHYPVTEAGVWGDCARERRPVIHNDYASLPHRRGLPAGHAPVIRELVVPVLRGPRIVAIIGVGNKPEDYTETDVQIASLLGDFSWEIVTRGQAEESLRQSEEGLRQREGMLNESQRVGQVGSWDWDLVNDVIWWSDEYYRLYGFTIGTQPPNYAEHLQAYTRESAERLDAAVKRALELGEPYELDLELAEPTPTTRWIAARGEVRRDANGSALGLRGTAQNITERKKAEEELRTLNDVLEQRVRERTAELSANNAELERMNRLFVGRELRMIELKERIRILKEATAGRMGATKEANDSTGGAE